MGTLSTCWHNYALFLFRYIDFLVEPNSSRMGRHRQIWSDIKTDIIVSFRTRLFDKADYICSHYSFVTMAFVASFSLCAHCEGVIEHAANSFMLDNTFWQCSRILANTPNIWTTESPHKSSDKIYEAPDHLSNESSPVPDVAQSVPSPSRPMIVTIVNPPNSIIRDRKMVTFA